jgi:hypothetical protein
MDFVLLKVILASVAFLLGVLNLLVMLEMMQKITVFGLPYETLSLWHRRQGDVIAALFAVTAAMCIKYFVLEGEPEWDSPRVAGHMLFAALVLALVAGKLLIVNVPRLRRGYRYIDYIGASLFASLILVFGTSAAWYFYKWITFARPRF